MKRLILSCLLGMLPTLLWAQLLVNGDFEDIWNCPLVFDSELIIDSSMTGWFATSQTADGWHTSCEAIAPVNTPNIPDAYAGDGSAGLFPGNESFGQLLSSPLDPACTYTVSFMAIGTHLGMTPPTSPPKCNYLCLYGTNTQPPAFNPFSIGVPAHQLPGAMLLGCSGNISDTTWQAYDLEFVPTEAFDYLIVSLNPQPNCAGVSYVCLDEMTMDKNCAVHVLEEVSGQVYATLQKGMLHVSSTVPIERLTIYDGVGRLVSDQQIYPSTDCQVEVDAKGMLIVQIELVDGMAITQKLMAGH